MRSFGAAMRGMALGGRPLTVHVTPDMEKRLLDSARRFNEDDDDPMPLGTPAERDDALEIVLLGAAENGLDSYDRDAERVWSITGGTWFHYPRSKQRRDALRRWRKRTIRRARKAVTR